MEKKTRLLLWFGDERGYNATLCYFCITQLLLWFGDERGYNATTRPSEETTPGCGLVMKEDITQLRWVEQHHD